MAPGHTVIRKPGQSEALLGGVLGSDSSQQFARGTTLAVLNLSISLWEWECRYIEPGFQL